MDCNPFILGDMMKTFINNLISVKSQNDLTTVRLKYNLHQKILVHCQDCQKPIVKQLKKICKRNFDELYCWNCAVENSNIQKYGVKNVFQLNTTKQKIKETCKNKFGEEHHMKTKTSQNKMKTTRLLNNNGKYRSFEETKSIRDTFYKKYKSKGNFGRSEVKTKSVETQNKLYGNNGCFLHSNAFNKTMIEKYGYINPDYIDECISKIHKRYNFDNRNFDSSWELAYYIWLKDHNITFDYHPTKIEYKFENKNHYYWPDFKIGNRFIEIKSPILYEKMQIQNTLENAKLNCMLEHKVIIITNCNKYIEYVNNKFGYQFIKSLKNK